MIVGIDLALRNIGIVVLDDEGEYQECGLITSDSKQLNNEALLDHNFSEVDNFFVSVAIKNNLPSLKTCRVGLEGLSFNSKSASVDLIAANHWNVRWFCWSNKTVLDVIPPKSWMKSIITKEVLASWAKSHPVTRAKKGMKLTKEETQANARSKAQIRKLGKQLIFDSVPEDVKVKLLEYVKGNKLPTDAIFDLSDAYHIARYTFNLGKKNV